MLLTALTTFLGVFPLIMETSLQAQFLIPLAVSIGFGVLFGTVIVVLSVPAVFIFQARITGMAERVLGRTTEPQTAEKSGSKPAVASRQPNTAKVAAE